MSTLDWWVIGAYLAAMLVLAAWLGLRQTDRSDYYLAGNKLPSWALATSIVATQCSTNSLLGAPAFVGFVSAGGMLWLQYELAVPLAMLVLCAGFMPLRRARVISIYAFLELRLGLASRLLASACFLFFRAVATGVTVYGAASIIELISGISFSVAIVLLMGITIVYDLLGGIRAVVISDVVQMFLLLSAVVLALCWLQQPLLDHYAQLSEAGRTQTLVNDWGLRSGNNYGFWPMLFGGLFLYVAYYGCDQSQAQRLLSASNVEQTQRVLTLNSLLRFPLVLSYCLLGLGLAAYAIEHPDFTASLPLTQAGEPNYNLVFPAFVQREFAAGFAGWPFWAILLAIIAIMVFMSELTSNTAQVATMLPILAALAPVLGVPTALMLVPATIAASCAFMMPVGTPPNAIVFGTGLVRMPQMMKADIWLNITGILLIFALTWFVFAPVLRALG